MENKYDLILLDCQMPVMDGYEATFAIRDYEKKHNLEPISILALTANAFEESREKCLSEGMNDVITKPINMNEFIHKLNKYINMDTFKKEPLNKEKAVGKIAAEMGLDKEDVEDLIDTFFKDFIKQQSMLKSAFKEQDYIQVNEIAHSIAGASANLRIDEISIPARALNNLLRDKNSYTNDELTSAKELLEKILSIEVY